MRRLIVLLALAGCAEADPQAVGAGLSAMSQQQQIDQIRRQQHYQQLQQPFRPILVQPLPRPRAWSCC